MDADLTAIIVAAIGAVGTAIGSVAVYLINQHIKDSQLRQVLANAVKNSIGFAEAVAKNRITTMKPTLHIPGVPPELQAEVQYVLDHAGEATSRFKITPDKVAQKVVSQIGLAAKTATTQRKLSSKIPKEVLTEKKPVGRPPKRVKDR